MLNRKARPTAGLIRPGLSFLGSTEQTIHVWQLDQDGKLAHDEANREWVAHDLISFSHDEDVTAFTTKRAGNSAPVDLIAGSGWNIEGYARVIEDGRVFYGTRRDRAVAPSNPGRIYSGVALLEHLIQKNKALGGWALDVPCVIGVVFEGDPTIALVLFIREPGGLFRKQSYVALYNNDPTGAIAPYIQSNGLSQTGDLDDNRIVMFTGSELVSELDAIQPYPNERFFFGIAGSAYRKIGLAGLGLLFVAGLGWVGKLEYEYQQLAKNKGVDAAELAQLSANNKLKAKAVHGAILESVSVDVGGVFKLAKAIQLPGGKVVLEAATPGTTRLKLIVPNDFPSSDLNAVAMSRQKPAGCEAPTISTPRGLRETHYTFECKSSTSALAPVLGNAR